MTRFQATVAILWNKSYFIYFALAFSAWIGSIFYPLFAIPASVLTFALFDLIGYEAVPANDKEHYPEGQFTVQSYRILQTMFQLAILTILLSFWDWKIALGFVIIHFTGGCDILYDLMGRYPVFLPYPRTWLRWTPLGWFKKEIYNFGFIIQAIVGSIVAILINVL